VRSVGAHSSARWSGDRDPGAAPAYRVRFLLRKLHGPYLELSLPTSLAQASLDVRLDGKRFRSCPPTTRTERHSVYRIVRLRVEPELYPPVVLDVAVKPARGASTCQRPAPGGIVFASVGGWRGSEASRC